MKLKCIKTVVMNDGTQAFTEGKEYRARKGNVQGLDGNPYEPTLVLRAKNDQGESHIVKRLKDENLNDFFCIHFEELQAK